MPADVRIFLGPCYYSTGLQPGRIRDRLCHSSHVQKPLMRMSRIEVPDESSMLRVGRSVAQELEFGDLVFLQGELGAGKTTIARGILSGFGWQDAVTSPTYTLVDFYDIGGKSFYHMDLYRLQSADELEMAGVRDMISPQSICLIEWPERGEGLLPEPDMEIRIRYRGVGREVEIAHRPRDLRGGPGW